MIAITLKCSRENPFYFPLQVKEFWRPLILMQEILSKYSLLFVLEIDYVVISLASFSFILFKLK